MATPTAWTEQLGIRDAGDTQLVFLGEAGYAWLRLNEPNKAIAVFEGLTALAPRDPVGFLGLSEANYLLGQFDEAAERARDAIHCQHVDLRTMAYAYVVQGKALFCLRRTAEAHRAWHKAIELDEAGPEAELARGYLQVLQPCQEGES